MSETRLLLCADCDALRLVDQHARCLSCGGSATSQANPGGEIKRLLEIEHRRKMAVDPLNLSDATKGYLLHCLWRWIECKRVRRVLRPIPRTMRKAAGQ